MVNFSRVFKGAGLWFVGLIVMFLINALIPSTINILDNSLQIGDTSLLRAFIWLGIIIIYILACLVLPMWNIIEGLKEGESGKFSYILIGIIFWIFSLGFVYVQYHYLPQLATVLATDGLTKAIFWGSTIITWITIVMIVPLYMIIKGYEKGEVAQ